MLIVGVVDNMLGVDFLIAFRDVVAVYAVDGAHDDVTKLGDETILNSIRFFGLPAMFSTPADT